MNIFEMNRVRTYIIAEAGVNHNGSIDLAEQIIDAAADAGADAVKFQSFISENVVSRHTPKVRYQKRTTDAGESQLEMIKRLELNFAAHERLISHCDKRKITFLSTPFDQESADMLLNIFRLERIKIPSGEITNAPLLLQLARSGRQTILSTGMATLGEIETALSVLAYGYVNSKEPPGHPAFQRAWASPEGQQQLRENVVLLHCTTEYPCPYEETNLWTMETLRAAFGLPVGLSDHTDGISVPIAAAALGAVLIEKHLTLDRDLPGPDHLASLEPEEFKRMIHGIRQVEHALGTRRKGPSPSEFPNRELVRKSLVASRMIQKGDQFTSDNLTAKRPGTGLSPMFYWDLLGRTASRDYDEDEVIHELC